MQSSAQRQSFSKAITELAGLPRKGVSSCLLTARLSFEVLQVGCSRKAQNEECFEIFLGGLEYRINYSAWIEKEERGLEKRLKAIRNNTGVLKYL